MRSFVESLRKIRELSPDVIMFGEYHQRQSQFRQLTKDFFEKAADSFNTVAIELKECHQEAVDRYFRNEFDYQAMSIQFEQNYSPQPPPKGLAELDLHFFEMLKEVFEYSPKKRLIFINSDDPSDRQGNRDSLGRDEFMANKIEAAVKNEMGPVVAILGLFHTFVRPQCFKQIHLDRVNKLGSSDSDDCQIFESAAELLVKRGISIFTFADIRKQETYPPLNSSWGGDVTVERLSVFEAMSFVKENAGRWHGNRLATELPGQQVCVPLTSWNCLFVTDEPRPCSTESEL